MLSNKPENLRIATDLSKFRMSALLVMLPDTSAAQAKSLGPFIKKWDDIDEGVNESFPLSDASAIG